MFQKWSKTHSAASKSAGGKPQGVLALYFVGMPTLSPGFVFGFNVQVAGNGVYIDPTTIAYVAGNLLVLNNTADRKQKIINSFVDPSLEGITCLSLAPSRKILAIACRAEKPEIYLFDTKSLRKKKSLCHADSTAKCSIISMQFTHNNEKLVALSGSPDCTIIVWHWLKGKKMYDIKLSSAAEVPSGSALLFSTTINLNPVDSETMVVLGPSSLRFFRLNEENARAIPANDDILLTPSGDQQQHGKISNMCWLKQPPDYFVVGNNLGKLALYGNGVFITLLNVNLQKLVDYMNIGVPSASKGSRPLASLQSTASNDGGLEAGSTAPIGVKSMVCVTSGLIIGCSDGGFRFLSRSITVPDGKPGMFELAHIWFPSVLSQFSASAKSNLGSMTTSMGSDLIGGGDRAVTHINLSESEDELVASFDDASLLRVNVAAPASVKGENMKAVSTLGHTPGIVTGLDVCVRKPLAVTCSLDKTIRVWNYIDQKLELTRPVSEDPWCVAFHPSGLHIVVGFSDKLRLMNLLMDDMRTYRELPVKLCREVQFSRGGQYFAAASQTNVILVYNFYTCEKLADLRGHSGKIKSISWTKDDTTLVTCGQDGAVYMFDWQAGKRLGEFVQKGIQFNAALATQDAIYAASSDLQLKRFEVPELQVAKEIGTQIPLSQIVLNSAETTLFATTGLTGQPGMIRSYECPVSADYVEYACMSTPITRLRITADDRVLIATDETGCVVAFDVKDRSDTSVSTKDLKSLSVVQRVGEHIMPWSEEVLITRSDLEEKNTSMAENRAKVEELQLHNEYQLRLRDMSYSEKVKEIQEKFMQDVEQEKNKYELLREEKNDMQMEFEERLKQMEDKHQHELQDEENEYQEQIMAEVEDYQRLIGERNMQKERWEEQRNALVSTHERYVRELTDDFEHKLEEDHHLHQQLEEEKVMAEKEYAEMQQQLEDDIDTEIENLRDRYDTQLNHERELTLRYKGENGIMKKRFTVLQQNIEDNKEFIKGCIEKEEELKQQIKALETEIKQHKREIKGRDETIGGKEKKIYDLKKKNQELEKFKFVLDYKIKELKRQIEPRETEISTMKNQIKDMDRELEQYHKSNAQLDLMIGDLRSKLDSMQVTIGTNRKLIGDAESAVMQFKGEIHDCVQFIQDPTLLSDAVRKMSVQYRISSKETSGTLDSNIAHEYHRHKDYLERTFQTMKEKFTQDIQTHQAANARIMRDNMNLIRDINKQREVRRKILAVLEPGTIAGTLFPYVTIFDMLCYLMTNYYHRQIEQRSNIFKLDKLRCNGMI